MFAGIRKLAKGLLFGGDGSLSSSRVVIFAVLIEINAVVVLCIAWIWHVTATGQMEAAAPLAQAVFTGVAAVLGAQATMAAIQYASQYKWGPGSYSGRQSDIDEARTSIVAGVEPAYIPDVSDLVPSDPEEPRVAAESSPSETALVTEEPIQVELTGETDESRQRTDTT